MTPEEVAMVARMRTSPFGCLAVGCTVTKPTYAEIDTHMADEHPELT